MLITPFLHVLITAALTIALAAVVLFLASDLCRKLFERVPELVVVILFGMLAIAGACCVFAFYECHNRVYIVRDEGTVTRRLYGRHVAQRFSDGSVAETDVPRLSGNCLVVNARSEGVTLRAMHYAQHPQIYPAARTPDAHVAPYSVLVTDTDEIHFFGIQNPPDKIKVTARRNSPLSDTTKYWLIY